MSSHDDYSRQSWRRVSEGVELGSTFNQIVRDTFSWIKYECNELENKKTILHFTCKKQCWVVSNECAWTEEGTKRKTLKM